MSLEGLFVEAANTEKVIDGGVDAAIQVETDSVSRRFCVSARVVHCNANGIGIMFLSFNQALFRMLDVLIATPCFDLGHRD